MSVLTSSPTLRVNFFTERGNFSVANQYPDTQKSDQLLGVQTSKDFRQPAGTFQVTLTAETFASQQVFQPVGTAAQQAEGIETTPVIRASQEGYGWKDLLKPGDMVVIEMGPDRPQPTDTYYARNFAKGLSGTTEVVMVGTIDDVTVRTSIGGDGKPTRSVTVVGRDLGKYLVDDSIIRDPWWNYIDDILRFRVALAKFPRPGLPGTPANIIRLIFNFWVFGTSKTAAGLDSHNFDVDFILNSQGTAQQAQVKALSDILRYTLDNATPEVPWLSSWVDFEGSPWALFESISGAPWYVLHIDTRRQEDVRALMTGERNAATPTLVNDKARTIWNTTLSRWNNQVSLMYYRNPASNRFYDDWTSLPTRVITPDDVIDETVSVSLEEVFTRWRSFPLVPGLDSVRAIISHEKERDLTLEKRFGIRPRMLNSPFYKDMKDPIGIALAERQTFQLKDWDILNRFLLSGSYTIKGMAQVRVGDRLHYLTTTGRGVDYLVEGVTQDFRPFVGWTTSLAVTRGQTHRERGETLFDASGNIVFNEFNAMSMVGR